MLLHRIKLQSVSIQLKYFNQISSIYDIRNLPNNTPIQHFQVGYLEDRMYLAHILNVK